MVKRWKPVWSCAWRGKAVCLQFPLYHQHSNCWRERRAIETYSFSQTSQYCAIFLFFFQDNNLT